jgi:hypothetical protein
MASIAPSSGLHASAASLRKSLLCYFLPTELTRWDVWSFHNKNSGILQ